MSVTIEIPDELAERLRAEADKHGRALPEYVLPSLEAVVPKPHTTPEKCADLPDHSEEAPTATVKRGPAYLEAILEVARSFTPEDLARMPPDGAREVDHYVYGLPKRGKKTS